MVLSTTSNKEICLQDVSSNSEADASELQENIEEMLPRYYTLTCNPPRKG